MLYTWATKQLLLGTLKDVCETCQQQIAPMDRFGCLIFIGLFIALVWVMAIVKQ